MFTDVDVYFGCFRHPLGPALLCECLCLSSFDFNPYFVLYAMFVGPGQVCLGVRKTVIGCPINGCPDVSGLACLGVRKTVVGCHPPKLVSGRIRTCLFWS